MTPSFQQLGERFFITILVVLILIVVAQRYRIGAVSIGALLAGFLANFLVPHS